MSAAVAAAAVAVEKDEAREGWGVVVSPQTIRRAVQGFAREVQGMKKKAGLAGRTERELAQKAKPMLREALREILQAQADGCRPECPVCGAKLENTRVKERSIRTQWGEVTIRRTQGYCPYCKQWVIPADVVLGLEGHTQNSPDWAEKMAYLATKVPPVEAAEILEHLTGEEAAPSRVERQVRRTGEKALGQRGRDEERALLPETRSAFALEQRGRLPKEPFVLVILMDAWMVRERDDWGDSEALRAQGREPQRWHDSKTARFYGIVSSDGHEGSRPSVAESGYVSTRLDAEGFSRLVWTEAVRYGALQATRVVIVADGGVWIWKIAEDRFPWADRTLDYYHGTEHLWALAQALYGEGTAEARQWFNPLKRQLLEKGGAPVIKTLRDLAAISSDLPVLADLERELGYFEKHKNDLDYPAKRQRGEPIGSGAIESACKQYQVRFKRGGQFWSRRWDEGLLELKSRQLSGRWHELWPHLCQPN